MPQKETPQKERPKKEVPPEPAPKAAVESKEEKVQGIEETVRKNKNKNELVLL